MENRAASLDSASTNVNETIEGRGAGDFVEPGAERELTKSLYEERNLVTPVVVEGNVGFVVNPLGAKDFHRVRLF